jgi:hypothetical protein
MLETGGAAVYYLSLPLLEKQRRRSVGFVAVTNGGTSREKASEGLAAAENVCR